MHYQAFIFFFVLLPAGGLYIYLLGIRSMDFELSFMTLLLTLVVCLFFGLLTVCFVFMRKYLPFKILIDNAGVQYSGLVKTVRARWDEIIGIKVIPMGPGILEVRTSKGTFCFPTAMKEMNRIYPKLKNKGMGMKWIYDDDTEKPVTPENCPVYIEIQRQLKEHNIDINI